MQSLFGHTQKRKTKIAMNLTCGGEGEGQYSSHLTKSKSVILYNPCSGCVKIHSLARICWIQTTQLVMFGLKICVFRNQALKLQSCVTNLICKQSNVKNHLRILFLNIPYFTGRKISKSFRGGAARSK
jgi:hypothetical protein